MQPDFDFGQCDENADLAPPTLVLSCGEVSVWQEVPAALFLSWPAARQFAYCATRDEDSALYEPNAEWYRQRAQSYKELYAETL